MSVKVDGVVIKKVVSGKLRDVFPKTFSKKYKPICIPQLALVLACFKSSNFEHEACGKELKMFYECVEKKRLETETLLKSQRHPKKLEKLYAKYPVI